MSRVRGLLITTALLAAIISTLRVYPHQLAYFNEFAGGPDRGYLHLMSSSVDWGQAHLDLRRWRDRHLALKPLYVALNASYSEQSIGIRDATYVSSIGVVGSNMDRIPAKPFWIAASRNYVHGPLWPRQGTSDTDLIHIDLRELALSQPAQSFGYAINLYRVE